MKRRNQGVITVYLALVMGMLLALIVSTVEAARVSMARTLIQRVLQTSMDSTLCEYYLPLFEHYQIYGRRLKNYDEEEKKQELILELQQETKTGFSPLSALDSFEKLFLPESTFLLCEPETEEIYIQQMSGFMESGGKEFKKQAISYSKYDLASKLIETILQSMGVITESNNASELITEKYKVEQKFMKIDQNIMRLIELVEGLKISDERIEQTFFLKNIKTQDDFIKKYVNFEITQTNLQINHKEIYDALKDNYEYANTDILSVVLMGKEAYMTYHSIITGMESLGIDISKQDIPSMDEIIGVSDTIQLVTSMQLDFFHNVRTQLEEAITILQNIKEQQDIAGQELINYKIKLREKESSISKELYDELTSDMEHMEQYVNKDCTKLGMINDCKQMKKTLQDNLKLMTDITSIPVVRFSFEEDAYQEWLTYEMSLAEKMLQYSQTGLSFDYSGVQLEKRKNTILSGVKDIIDSGLVGLVIEDNLSVSNRCIVNNDLPSKAYFTENIETTDQIMKVLSMQKDDAIQDSGFAAIGYGRSDTETNRTLLEDLLFQSYIYLHTTSYQSTKMRPGQMLHYEQEYLLFGNSSDRENLESFLLRLIIVRTITGMIPIMTDKNKVSQAYEFALATVGFAGLPFLVTVVKYIILFIWGLEQALVEVAVLLSGRRVPFITRKEDIVIKFEDLLLLSKSNIQAKAKEWKEDKSVLSLNYCEYLMIAIYFQEEEKTLYRMLDLIQENIRYEYEDDFHINQCITGYQIQTSVTMQQKFLFLPFFNQQENTIQGYRFFFQRTSAY